MTCRNAKKDAQTLSAFAVWLGQQGGISPPEAAEACRSAGVVRAGAGDGIFSAGETPGFLYFVRSGLVRFYYLTADGKEFNKSFATAGGVVTCLSSFLEGAPSSFHTQALEDTELVALPMELARQLPARDRAWERLISTVIAQLALRKERREAAFLLQSASERYEAFLREFPEVAQRLPQYHVASYLGITPVALSRIRARRGS
ncbi:Crp/Fnr family transcriptional regulator [Roseibium sp.]|uniref:Crp/Fnr family transcriptional regulator n=1 Tax=Roseibium sp. TaxID=1936156 RepID=UPI003D0FD84A